MTQKSNIGKITTNILRYTALILLTLTFAFSAPSWNLARKIVDGLTDEASYVNIIKDLGIGQLTTDAILNIKDLLPPSVLKYLDDGTPGQPSSLQRLNAKLGEAVDLTIAQVVSKIPAYIVGNRDNIDGSVNLVNLKNEANKIAAKKAASLPLGGSLIEGMIKDQVNKKIPDSYCINSYLKTLETTLLPLRTSVSGLNTFIKATGVLCILTLILIALISFNIVRAVRWLGINLLLAGSLAALLGGVISSLFGLVIPAAVLKNAIFNKLLFSSVDQFNSSAVIWIIVGTLLIAISFAIKAILKTTKSKPTSDSQ